MTFHDRCSFLEKQRREMSQDNLRMKQAYSNIVSQIPSIERSKKVR